MSLPYPKFPLKAFISVVMHFLHMGREQLFGYRAGLTDKNIGISITCGVYLYNQIFNVIRVPLYIRSSEVTSSSEVKLGYINWYSYLNSNVHYVIISI